MKIDLSSLEKTSSPIELFYSGCKAEQTRKNYTSTLRKIVFEYFEDILTEEAFEDRINELIARAKKDPEWVMKVLIALVDAIKKRTELPSTDKNYAKTSIFDVYFPAIKKLLDMNEIPIVWKKLYSLYPEKQGDEDTRGYTRDEIIQMLQISNAMDSSIILIASSSGIRLGAFDFRWKHIKPVYDFNGKLVWEDEDVTESVAKAGKIVCGMILVYSDSKESQFAFITPETYNAIQTYRTVWIQETGKEPKPEDPFLKHEGMFVKSLGSKAVWIRIQRIAKKVGLRQPLVKGKRRHKSPLMNGFRRFFNKKNKESFSKDSTLAQLIKKEFMMGHTGLIQLDRNYFKTHVNELVEEYLNAVPNLTISNEIRNQAVIEKQQRKITEFERKEIRINDLEAQLEQVQTGIEALKKTKSVQEN